MWRIIISLLLLASFLFSSNGTNPMTSEDYTIPQNNTLSVYDKIDEDTERLIVINKEDIKWSGIYEAREIDITEYITLDEFNRIIELVLTDGELFINGTLFGELPSHTFGAIRIYLIPDLYWRHEGGNRENYFKENKVNRLELRAGWSINDPLDIISYDILHNCNILENSTDTQDFFKLSVGYVDTGITDEQILMQFISYLNEVKNMI